MKFIYHKPCSPATLCILHNPAADILHHHKHGDSGKFLPHIPDAIDQKAVVDIHICFMGEDVQGTADKQFQ